MSQSFKRAGSPSAEATCQSLPGSRFTWYLALTNMDRLREQARRDFVVITICITQVCILHAEGSMMWLASKTCL